VLSLPLHEALTRVDLELICTTVQTARAAPSR
jgi:hypothetical protein